MILRHELVLPPEQAADEPMHIRLCAAALQQEAASIRAVVPRRRSLDARGRIVRIRLLVDVYVDEDPPASTAFSFSFQQVQLAPAVVIAGSGPAGLFAALRLLELGLRPVIVERGKE